jgi:hypothetical protein
VRRGTEKGIRGRVGREIRGQKMGAAKRREEKR